MSAKRAGSKQSDPEATYNKAAKAELSKDYDAAFRGYIDAATACLALARSAADARAQTRWRSLASKALERAERIKAVKSGLTPVIRNPLSPDEQALVLKRGSTVNGLHVPLWSEADSGAFDSTTRYHDADGQPKLSAEQERVGTTWKRPEEIFQDIELFTPDLRGHDIVQRVIEDCSLCTSIAVCLEHSSRHGSKAALPTLRPCDVSDRPERSKSGRYDLRVWFNGAHRRVTIDEDLPFHPDGSLMCLSTADDKSDIWPALVEKAYLKLMGGYDFPGSNSSIDIHVLSGWIPEQIEIRSSSFKREHTWFLISQSFNSGLCLLTAGTDDRPSSSREGLHLLPAHSYAITDLVEGEDGQRCLTVLDSWQSRGPRRPDSPASSLSRLSLHECGHVGGSFTVEWDHFCNVFDSLYFSWNPRLFSRSVHIHGTWRASHLSETDFEESNHLTLSLLLDELQSRSEASSETSVWVLLTRHRTDTQWASDYISLHVDNSRSAAEVSVGQHGPDQPAGFYTNSPHFLVKSSLAHSSSMLAITTLYEGSAKDVGFTVTAYSTRSMRWQSYALKLPFDSKVTGSFTTRTAGGNYTLPTYMSNPQYRLRVSPTSQSSESKGRKVQVAFTLRSEKNLPVNLTVVWGQGTRVFDLVRSDVVTSTGAYMYGFAHVKAELIPGDYTAIVSSFDTTQHGQFSLRMESSEEVHLDPILQEGAGMFMKTVQGEWMGTSAAGADQSNAYTSNPSFELYLPLPSQIRARLQLISKTTFINVSIFPADPYRSALLVGKPLVSSGPYTDSLSGAVTAPVQLEAGKYTIIPSTYDSGVEGRFKIIVYSSNSGFSVTPIPE